MPKPVQARDSNMPSQAETDALLEQLGDPSRSSQALLALLMKGRDGVRALVEFLRSSKPSSLPGARLMAVEGLSIVKDPEALSALIDVAGEPLDAISDPVFRLAEQTVASRAARILADFPNPRAREALLKLVKGKPLVGVAEAFEKSWDLRAIPYLVSWLEEDFVAEAASRALRVCGRFAFSPLIDSMGEKHLQYERETGMSQRRRARILEILDDLIRGDEVCLIEGLLDDPVEAVRLNAARAVLNRGNRAQQERAFEVALHLLDSPERNVRTLSEEILLGHFDVGADLVEQEIRRRGLAGESAQQFFPQESTLVILLRILKKGRQLREARW
jgi:HEAT repeat protein